MQDTTLVETWMVETVVLSYIIAVTGSFCTIQIMEQWRFQESARAQLTLLVLASVALGGCGIWAMHFTGMQAMYLALSDGIKLKVNFEVGMTVLSLLFPICGVFLGLEIASKDPFFLELEQSRRKAIVAGQMKDMAITEMLNRSAVQRKIKIVALFSRPWRILMGGLCAALGVLGMHYLGMMAQRSATTMSFSGGIVVASCVVAFVTATAAFWIIFRALTFWPHVDMIRIGSALVMGVAVCGTHYIGMGAARYEYDPSATADGSSTVIDGDVAFRVATNGSLVLCFWMVSLTVVRDLRVSVASSLSTRQRNATGQNSSGGAGAAGLSGKQQDPVMPYASGGGGGGMSLSRNAVQPSGVKSAAMSSFTRNKNEPNAASWPATGPPLATADDPSYGVVPGRI